MRAVVIDGYGGPEVLRWAERPDPVPADDEVLLKVAASSINPVDTMERAGMLKEFRPVSFPGILGWDVSGTVLQVGSDVRGFSVGDRVFAWAYHSYAELCNVKAGLLGKLPARLDLAEAAALPLVTVTGAQLISVGGGVKAHQSVLVSGALGGVGRSAVYAAKEAGAFVIAAVRGTQMEEASALGADQVVALDDDGALADLLPVDVVANCVRGGAVEKLLGKVKRGGTFASATGVPNAAKECDAIRVVSFVSKQDPETMVKMAEAVVQGRLLVPISRRIPLKDARKGHEAVEKGGVGKILLLP